MPKHVIVDCKSTFYLKLIQYLQDNQFLNFLEEHRFTIFLHQVTDSLLTAIPTPRYLQSTIKVKWVNAFFRKRIELDNNLLEKSLPVINLTYSENKLFCLELSKVHELGLSLSQGIKDERFEVVSKQRLTMIKRSVYPQITHTIRSLVAQSQASQ